MTTKKQVQVDVEGVISKFKEKHTSTGKKYVSYTIKEGDKYHNFKTWIDSSLPNTKPIADGARVHIQGTGNEETWDWKGKTMSNIVVDISLVRGVVDLNDDFPTEEYEEQEKKEETAKYADIEIEEDEFNRKAEHLQRLCAVIKDMSPEFQQAIAKDIARIL